MKPSEPPELATWLLEHFVLGNKNEALAGDLLEEFRQRRTVAWYWRQVLGAILVGFLSELRAQWLAVGFEVVCFFGFATVWTCAVSVYEERVFFRPPFQSLGHWLISHHEPERAIYGWAISILIAAVINGVGLSLYLTIMRSFNLRRFSRGLLISLLVVIVGHLGETFLNRIAVTLLLVRIVEFLFPWFSLLPFFALMLSMWAARPYWKRSSNESSRIIV
jgi:hypothetical protein